MSLFTGYTRNDIIVNSDINMNNHKIIQNALPISDNDLVNKKYIDTNYEKKLRYKLSYSTYWHYSSNGGSPSENKVAWSLPFITLNRNTKIKLISISFDTDGVVPNGLKINYYLEYFDIDGTLHRKLLGKITHNKIFRSKTLFSGCAINKEYNLSDIFTSADKDPYVGYIYISKPVSLPSNNESLLLLSVYNYE